jgi:diguanylate cyclase (GGDEF)-like protein/PAS domain S-box-containing protein
LADILARAVMDSPATVVITGPDGVIQYVNRRFTALTGYTPQEAIGRKASLLKSGLMPPRSYRTLWRRLKRGEDWIGEFHNRRKSGELFWEHATISPVRDSAGRIRHYLKIAEDITDRQRLEAELAATLATLRRSKLELQTYCERLEAVTRELRESHAKMRRLAREDALTGLLNRRGFDGELRRARAQAVRRGERIGFLMLDIDRFKQINDRYGHAAGDRLLKSLARLLRANLRASDLICRQGGDEIVVAMPAADAATTGAAAARLLAAVRRQRVAIGGRRLAFTVSIGASCGKPVAGKSLRSDIRLADRALYWVKQHGQNEALYWTFRQAAAAERRARQCHV